MKPYPERSPESGVTADSWVWEADLAVLSPLVWVYSKHLQRNKRPAVASHGLRVKL